MGWRSGSPPPREARLPRGPLTILDDDFDEPHGAGPRLGEEFPQLLGGYKHKKHGGLGGGGGGGQGGGDARQGRGRGGLCSAWRGLAAERGAGLNTAPHVTGNLSWLNISSQI